MRCATLRYAVLRYATLRYATLRYFTLLYSTSPSRYASPRYTTLPCPESSPPYHSDRVPNFASSLPPPICCVGNQAGGHNPRRGGHLGDSVSQQGYLGICACSLLLGPSHLCHALPGKMPPGDGGGVKRMRGIFHDSSGLLDLSPPGE